MLHHKQVVHTIEEAKTIIRTESMEVEKSIFLKENSRIVKVCIFNIYIYKY